jgi:uncharacterized RDD family membrane protein YckC
MEVPTSSEVKYCAECGKPRPVDDLARFGITLICPDCKETYIHKLREGVTSSQATKRLAGFWIRFAGSLIDGVILFVVQATLQFACIALAGFAASTQLAATLFLNLAFLTIGSTYEAIMISRYGATLGKMAVGIKVIRPDQSPITLGRGYGRYGAKLISGMLLGIGYLMAAFDVEKRALHDRICDTRVVLTR